MITIANASRQHHNFNYRIPGAMQTTLVKIPSGTQVQIGKDFGVNEKEAIVSQLQRIGARSRSEMLTKPDPRFRGLVYSMDKPLNEDDLMATADTVIDGADITSAQEMMQSVLGADRALESVNGGARRGRSSGLEIKTTDTKGKVTGEFATDLAVDPSAPAAKLPR